MKQAFTGEQMSLPFQGELMECHVCHKKKRSRRDVESGWTTMTVLGAPRRYFCPKCFKKFINRLDNL
jgi:hypothetical protein